MASFTRTYTKASVNIEQLSDEIEASTLGYVLVAKTAGQATDGGIIFEDDPPDQLTIFLNVIVPSLPDTMQLDGLVIAHTAVFPAPQPASFVIPNQGGIVQLLLEDRTQADADAPYTYYRTTGGVASIGIGDRAAGILDVGTLQDVMAWNSDGRVGIGGAALTGIVLLIEDPITSAQTWRGGVATNNTAAVQLRYRAPNSPAAADRKNFEWLNVNPAAPGGENIMLLRSITDAQVTSTNDIWTVQHTGAIGFGVRVPDASARVQIDSTTRGFLAPRMTEVERDAISSPSTLLQVGNTDTNAPEYFDGNAWVSVSSPYYESTTRLTDAASTTDVFASYLLLTTASVTPGTYRWQAWVKMSGSAQQTGLGAQMVINTVAQPDVFLSVETGIADGLITVHAEDEIVVASTGAQTIDIEFNMPSGSGTANALAARIVFYRVA